MKSNTLQLIAKEVKLSYHPTSFLFIALSAMMLIPSYPYYVVFFYTSLAVFFIAVNGRENHDIEFTMLLPVKKSDVVRGRFLSVMLLELVQMIFAVPFAIIRNYLIPVGNSVGMDANMALFGMCFIMLGLFNLVFLPMYYKNPLKIGIPFVVASIVTFLYMAVAETMVHAVPFFRDVLDTKDPQFLPEKLMVLAAGILIFALLTIVSYNVSKKRFEKLSL